MFHLFRKTEERNNKWEAALSIVEQRLAQMWSSWLRLSYKKKTAPISKMNNNVRKKQQCSFTSEQDMFELKWALMADGKVHDTECRQVIMSHLWHNGAALLICMAMDYVVLSFIPDTRYDNGGGVCANVCVRVCERSDDLLTDWLEPGWPTACWGSMWVTSHTNRIVLRGHQKTNQERLYYIYCAVEIQTGSS